MEHEGIKQRWIVVYSQGSEERANCGIQKAIEKESDLIKKEAKNFKRKKFCCQDDAKIALSEFLNKLNYHELTDIEYKQTETFKRKGRPRKGEALKLMHWEISFNRPLSKPLIQFQIIDPSNQIETKCKSFSSIAIAVSNDLKSFQHSNHVLVNYSITR